MHEPMSADSPEGKFAEAVKVANELRTKYVDPRIRWYRDHTSRPRTCFRVAGILTIILSASLPAVAVASFRYKEAVLSVMSISIAVLAGFSTFFRWERTWRGNSNAQMALEQHVAKWELELTNARLIIADDERLKHVYQATDDLLANARSVVSAESEGFFSALQFPQQNSQPKE
jgi:Protein of unknown function (DUF4231)